MKKLFIISLVLASTACMTTPPLPAEQRPPTWAKPINSEQNFYQVSPTLFRSEQPDVLFLPQLKKHRIQHIINLRHTADNAQLFNPKQFQLTHIPIHTWQINRQDLLNVMRAIKQAEQRGEKVLIHCYHGADRTGASIAMYRIIFQHWTIEQAVQEMKHGGYHFHRIWKNIEQLFT
ncbi:MAG: dual specificity protein phosphatase family protein, partial [Acinetobacter sp.]|nr:dual specificity protein phosphatase family protein [Acinetobacter sp.]